MSEHNVISPLPGVFYRSPAPGQPRFIEEGATVEADQTVGLVEIMKQFTEIKAGAKGVVTSFAVEDNGTLSPGDLIVVIETK
ncbi:acetyl-CoA carboxylase [Nocardia cyriacigeorgica]|uniref:Biotin carboxyl carrier protein of acetyl-CoA carboxylase n=1 Tax=Nocardia cyriacigeorgica TaxID=135487 RepID=A0A4U8VUF9_9NOCA|nr:acetyl-CoA carboxylase [Nocardia cyriacigeorgica]VFA96922.1 Biotin carboxyl carrier protein of acetyl-CoA carboxylase [Nocardia cyriacigeorgica]